MKWPAPRPEPPPPYPRPPHEVRINNAFSIWHRAMTRPSVLAPILKSETVPHGQ